MGFNFRTMFIQGVLNTTDEQDHRVQPLFDHGEFTVYTYSACTSFIGISPVYPSLFVEKCLDTRKFALSFNDETVAWDAVIWYLANRHVI